MKGILYNSNKAAAQCPGATLLEWVWIIKDLLPGSSLTNTSDVNVGAETDSSVWFSFLSLFFSASSDHSDINFS